MSVEEFLTQVAWPGVQPSPSGGGEASTTQEPEPTAEDELVPPEPAEEAGAQEPISTVPV